MTVPGAAAGWVDTVDTFGSGKVSKIMQCKIIFLCFDTGKNAGRVRSHWVRFVKQTKTLVVCAYQPLQERGVSPHDP